MASLDSIRVLLADDQAMIRQGIGYIIELQSDMTVVGEAADGREAAELAERLRPDVILMDVRMPGMTGIEATREIVQRQLDTKIVILTTFDDQEYIYQGIRAGAVGYLLKDAEAEELLNGVRSAFQGEAVYKSKLASGALQRMAAPEGEVSFGKAPETSSGNSAETIVQIPMSEPLTDREREILQEMAYGLRNDEIGRKLFIAEGTVKSHVHRILQKLGCEDRTQAVVAALRSGMVK
ncbi:response regulator transcription factor [Cohnella lubricantis]|nr:response regulator transcription factor [Cohnella lubricantis]MBP2118028.1 DNA-binding NarL/FixJ family response regulator [Cohnella lubricantis]